MSTGTATSICVEVAATLIEGGHLDRMAEWQAQENLRRTDLMATFRHLWLRVSIPRARMPGYRSPAPGAPKISWTPLLNAVSP